MQTGTLKELDAREGDVVDCVEWSDGDEYEENNPHYVMHGEHGFGAYENNDGFGPYFEYEDEVKFRIVSRAPDGIECRPTNERLDLLNEINELLASRGLTVGKFSTTGHGINIDIAMD